MQLEHPAISAWRELRPQRVTPERLEVLEEGSQVSAVYRLVHVGNGDSAVIAKRCRQGTAVIERSIYEEILPKLPLPMLHYYGYVEESDGEFCWLFLEDVSGANYHPRFAAHRVAAARWLGTMNTYASNLAAVTRLPKRGPDHYLGLLQSTQDEILSSIANPALGVEDVALLERVLAQCNQLERTWDQLAHACEKMPRTLVHGDFITKNVGVRFGGKGIIFLPFDWEKAGWGITAEDISRVDITTYWSTVRDFWPELSVRAFERMAEVGKVFRCLVFLHWIAPSLALESIEQPMNDIGLCEGWLEDLIRTAEWNR